MGRIREKIDQELAGMTFSDSMMERVLEQTSQSAEETKREEEWVLRILDVVQEEPMSGFEILMKLAGEDSRMQAEGVSEKELYPVLHRMTERSLLSCGRGEKNGKERMLYEITPAGRARRALGKDGGQKGEDLRGILRGICHGEG